MARVFMKGCEAIAEAAVRSGCRFFAGYPITPQNEIPEYFARRMPEVGGVFVQGESEVASVNMVYGAAQSGTRSMTSSSSCGISLKSEGISFCASARIPMVYCNVQSFPLTYVLHFTARCRLWRSHGRTTQRNPWGCVPWCGSPHKSAQSACCSLRPTHSYP